MPSILLYLMKCSISLAIVWLFYQLLLRRLTFYAINRWYLLLYSVLAFFIPVIDISSQVGKTSAREPLIIRLIPSMEQYTASSSPPVAAGPSSGWDPWSVWLMVAALGSLFLLLRMVLRWRSLISIRRISVPGEYNGIKICQVERNIIPFSFGDAVYVNTHLYSDKELEEIIQHEAVHIRQKHTSDILLAELLTIVNWYNPFVWLIRHSIRQNLEFIADNEALKKGLDKKSYQYHLLKVVGQVEYKLANNFNFSSLKKRIIMMNKLRSTRLHLVKFLFILPLITVLLVSFRNSYKHTFSSRRSAEEVYINEAGIVADYHGYTPLEGVTVVDKTSGMSTITDARGFFHMSVPVRKDTLDIRIEFHKDGYDDTWTESYYSGLKGSTGLISVGILVKNTEKGPMMVPPYMGKPPRQEPTYEDAMEVFKVTVRETESVQSYGTMRTEHPEVAMFYTTEDKRKQIVILKDGQVERYGYQGGMSVADMEKKYGNLPGMMMPQTATVNKGYLSVWEKISTEAEKTFHTGNPSVRHIIFPGDSRVLVVPVSGRPEMYDMDNDDPKERPAFEQSYGKLPDCVPPPGLHTHSGDRKSGALRTGVQ